MLNKTRLNENIESLEKLVTMLKAVSEDKSSLSNIGKEFGMTSQEVNYNLNRMFSMYFKKIKSISDQEIQALIISKDLPSTRLLKALFGFEPNDTIVFPDVDEDSFWNAIKSIMSDKYYEVVSLRHGYNTEKPMTFEQIGNKLNLTRARIKDIYYSALSKIDSSVLYKIFSISYVDKTEEIKKSSEYVNAVAEYEKFMMYMSKVNDIKKINEYIEKNYPEVASFDNNTINKSFSTPVEQLNLSNRLTNALKKNGKLTLNDIYNTTAAEYRSFSNFGKKCCLELAEVLSNRTDTHPNRVTLSRDLFTISTLNGE